MKIWMTLLAGTAVLTACASPVDFTVPSAAETVRVAGEGDAADDPAVWRAPAHADSLILVTDKRTGLYAYNLDGSVHAYLPVGRLNNVDVRYDMALPGPWRDIAVATDRTNNALAVFLIDPQTRSLEAWPVIPLTDFIDPYGACLYRSPTGALYAFATDKDPGTVVQLLLRYDGEGVISGEEVRRFATGSTTEGCVADDRTGRLYVGEENVAIWTIGAEPDAGTELQLFADVDGRVLVADVEGLGILDVGDAGGWLIASSQGDSAYTAYTLPEGEYAGRFRIAEGAVDGASHTDGLEVHAAPLGETYPQGAMIVQDDEEDTGGQNFKLVDLRTVLEALRLTSDE